MRKIEEENQKKKMKCKNKGENIVLGNKELDWVETCYKSSRIDFEFI